jgi:tetratricopeptide (TPR) repeat protein
LAAGFHLFYAYRDNDRARVQIAIAAKTLPNNPDLLHLTAQIDRVQGQWERSTADLQRAASLDPRNPALLEALFYNYECLRRYREAERIFDRLIELEPNKPDLPLTKAFCAYAEKADVKGTRAVCEALPRSVKDDRDSSYYRLHRVGIEPMANVD